MKKLIYTLALALILYSAFLIPNCSAQWQTDVRLTNNDSSSNTSYNNNAWCVAANGSVVHVVWEDYRDWNYGAIYYKRSTDAGVTWGTDTRLTNHTSGAGFPSVSVSGSVVHVVFMDGRNNIEIYYIRSTNAGVSWEPDVRISNNSADSEAPSVTASGSDVQVVWHDYRDGNTEIYYKRSTDAGVNWGTETRLTNNTYNSIYPSVSVSGSVVHVVWKDSRDGINGEMYYKRSTDAGISWGSDVRMTNNSEYTGSGSVAVSGSVVHVVWLDERDGNSEIYYKYSTDAGVSWGADTRLTNNTLASNHPSIAVSGQVVHVIWQDLRDGNNEIYYKNSLNAGVSWGTDTRLTNNSADSYQPSVAVSGLVVHVVWYDIRDGNYEIYYKRNPTGNLVNMQNITTEIPSKYSLEQNYPNPFNPSTVIRFQVTGNSNVVVKVYDVQGREVQTLVNERLQAGTYETTFDGAALNSGVYFYKLITNNYTETKRMILMK